MNTAHQQNKHNKRFKELSERISDLSRLIALQDSNTVLGQVWIARFQQQRDCLIETLRHNYPLMVVKPLKGHSIAIMCETQSEGFGVPIQVRS